MIKRVNKWLNKPGNTHSKLAFLMNFKTTNTICFWQKNNCVPKKCEDRLKHILNGSIKATIEEKENVQKSRKKKS